MTRILARDVVLSCRFTGGEVVLDPLVLLDFTMKDLARVLHSVAREVFTFGDYADAHHVVVLRDVPEPALVRDVSHGCRAFINAGFALRTAVVCPHSDLVEVRI